jgi:hypothetical protein
MAQLLQDSAADVRRALEKDSRSKARSAKRAENARLL